MSTPAYFSDAEIDELCEGLTQPAAMVRHLRRMGLRVTRKPNGRPLAWRPETWRADDAGAAAPAQNDANPAGLQQWAARRQTKQREGTRRHGTTAQGR